MFLTFPKVGLDHKITASQIDATQITGFQKATIHHNGTDYPAVKMYTARGMGDVFATETEFATKLAVCRRTGVFVKVNPIVALDDYSPMDVDIVNAEVTPIVNGMAT